MRSPQSVDSLETLGRVRLSRSFFMRDFLYSEIANFHGIPNIPENPDLAIETGKRLCEELLEPLQATFGRIAIRSAYRSPAVNALGNEKGHNCGSNESNYAAHIWHEAPKREIECYIPGHSRLLLRGEPPREEYASWYAGFPPL